MSLKKCIVHNEESFIYCTECGRAVCNRCVVCRDHKTISFKDLMKKYQENLSPHNMESYKREVSDLLESIKPEIEEYKSEISRDEKRIQDLEVRISGSEKGKREDLASMKEIEKQLRIASLKAFTETLKGKYDRMLRNLDVTAGILTEIAQNKRDLEILKQRLQNTKQALGVSEKERSLFEKVREGSMEDRQLALVFCLEGGLLKYNVDCEISKFSAMERVERRFDIDAVMRRELVDMGEGISISEPVVVEKSLRAVGRYFMVSLSHKGILAIFSTTRDTSRDYIYKQGDGLNIIQITDLEKERQTEIEVEDCTNIAFYDDKIMLLIWNKPLRETNVEEIFSIKNIIYKKFHFSVFRDIKGVNNVNHFADTSLLQSRRLLCYASTEGIPYEYNVDTKKNIRIEIEKGVTLFSSFMGIDCGTKTIFQDRGSLDTYALGWNDSVTLLHRSGRKERFRSLFVSPSGQNNLSEATLRYNSHLVRKDQKIETRNPIRFEPNSSIIRLYHDVFLLYDMNTKKWVLSRIFIP